MRMFRGDMTEEDYIIEAIQDYKDGSGMYEYAEYEGRDKVIWQYIADELARALKIIAKNGHYPKLTKEALDRYNHVKGNNK